MNKLNERLTLIANISVVLGIIFLAFELQQNTQAIQAQTRDSITEKQMEYYGSCHKSHLLGVRSIVGRRHSRSSRVLPQRSEVRSASSPADA